MQTHRYQIIHFKTEHFPLCAKDSGGSSNIFLRWPKGPHQMQPPSLGISQMSLHYELRGYKGPSEK